MTAFMSSLIEEPMLQTKNGSNPNNVQCIQFDSVIQYAGMNGEMVIVVYGYSYRFEIH